MEVQTPFFKRTSNDWSERILPWGWYFLLSLALSGWKRLRLCTQAARSANTQYYNHPDTVPFLIWHELLLLSPNSLLLFPDLYFRSWLTGKRSCPASSSTEKLASGKLFEPSRYNSGSARNKSTVKERPACLLRCIPFCFSHAVHQPI